MSEYKVSVWAQFARSALRPIPRIRQYTTWVETDSAQAAAQVAYEAESTPQRLTNSGVSRSLPRALPRVYVEVETGAGVCRLGDLALKMETRASQKAVR